MKKIYWELFITESIDLPINPRVVAHSLDNKLMILLDSSDNLILFDTKARRVLRKYMSLSQIKMIQFMQNHMQTILVTYIANSQPKFAILSLQTKKILRSLQIPDAYTQSSKIYHSPNDNLFVFSGIRKLIFCTWPTLSIHKELRYQLQLTPEYVQMISLYPPAASSVVFSPNRQFIGCLLPLPNRLLLVQIDGWKTKEFHLAQQCDLFLYLSDANAIVSDGRVIRIFRLNGSSETQIYTGSGNEGSSAYTDFSEELLIVLNWGKFRIFHINSGELCASIENTIMKDRNLAKVTVQRSEEDGTFRICQLKASRQNTWKLTIRLIQEERREISLL